MSIGRFFGLVFPAAAALAQTFVAPITYSVTTINNLLGTAVTMTVYRDGSRAMIENTGTGAHTRSVYDLTAHSNISWDADHPEVGCSTGKYSGDWGDPFTSADIEGMLKSSPPAPAPQTINGLATKVYEAADPASKVRIKVWREVKTGLYVRVDMTDPATNKTITMIETKQFSTAKPNPALFILPSGCLNKNGDPPKFQTALDKFAEEVGGSAADYEDATRGPGSPNSCTMLLRFVGAHGMQPLSNFQVALDLDVDLKSPPQYSMGGSPSGRTVFSGGHLKEYTAQVRNGVLRVDNMPDHFDMETTFAGGNKGASSAILYRHCTGPQTVLLYVLKNPDSVGEGADWMWVKSGKFATAAGQ